MRCWVVPNINLTFSNPTSLQLADAQHAVARDYGFASWAKLKEHVDALARVVEPAELLSAAVCASDADKTARVRLQDFVVH